MSRAIPKFARMIGYSLVPAAAMVLAWPIGSLPWTSPKMEFAGLLLVGPFYLGLLGSPAFLYVAYSSARAAELRRRTRTLVRVGLACALLASVGGVIWGFMMPLVIAPAAVSTVSVVILWRGFERNPGTASPASSS